MTNASGPHHYPPDLTALLVDVIPLLRRSKADAVDFFRACGVSPEYLADLQRRVDTDRASINKYEIVRTVIKRINEQGDAGLNARRLVLRRVVEWKDFSTCWSEDALKAQGLVASVRQMVNTKDSFTRMQQERDREREERMRPQREAAAAAKLKSERRQALCRRLISLFPMADPGSVVFKALLNEIQPPGCDVDVAEASLCTVDRFDL